MRIEESKTTIGLWYIINQYDKIIKVLTSKEKAMAKMAEIQRRKQMST